MSYRSETPLRAMPRRGAGKERKMDFGGLNWTLITIVGAALLAVVIAWAALRNRPSRAATEESEAATRRVYDEEEREHRGESDDVP